MLKRKPQSSPVNIVGKVKLVNPKSGRLGPGEHVDWTFDLNAPPIGGRPVVVRNLQVDGKLVN